MCECCQPDTATFFDSIALKWDSWEDLESLNVSFDAGLKHFGVKPHEHILDVGCGTGNLTSAILKLLSQEGRITAIDISGKMVDVAKTKVSDSRVKWICDAVEHMSSAENSFDRIICYSVWPHLKNPEMTARLFCNLLKKDGKLLIWHLKSREAINKIHSSVSPAVSNHQLVPAVETAILLEKTGFAIEETLDDDSGYLVSARKVLT